MCPGLTQATGAPPETNSRTMHSYAHVKRPCTFTGESLTSPQTVAVGRGHARRLVLLHSTLRRHTLNL